MHNDLILLSYTITYHHDLFLILGLQTILADALIIINTLIELIFRA